MEDLKRELEAIKKQIDYYSLLKQGRTVKALELLKETGELTCVLCNYFKTTGGCYSFLSEKEVVCPWLKFSGLKCYQWLKSFTEYSNWVEAKNHNEVVDIRIGMLYNWRHLILKEMKKKEGGIMKNRKEVVIGEAKNENQISLFEVSSTKAIFAVKDNQLAGLLVCEHISEKIDSPLEWILKTGGHFGATGYHNSRKQCIESCLEFGFKFYINIPFK